MRNGASSREAVRGDILYTTHNVQARVADPALRHFGVVMVGHAAHQLAQLEVGAALRQHGGLGG